MSAVLPPFQHQVEGTHFVVEHLRAHNPGAALFMETGTGKTKTAYMVAQVLAGYKAIDTLFVVAPNGVHKDWIRESLPLHWDFEAHPALAAYHSASNKAAERKAVEKLFWVQPTSNPPLRILTGNIESLVHKKHFDLYRKFLRLGRALIVLDESDMIKTPGIRTSRCACSLASLARFRLIMTGTDVSEGPFDYYSQFQFLEKGLLGHRTFATFKARYAEWEKKYAPDPKHPGQMREYPVVKAYQNLSELKANVAQHSFRALKKDCIDLPDQLFVQQTVVLGPEQRAAYNVIRERILAELAGGTVTSIHAFTKMLRLQQVAGGFIQYDDKMEPTPTRGNAKLDALLQRIEATSLDTGIIIWARFIPELEAIYKALTRGDRYPGTVSRYWGDVPTEERAEGAEAFKDGRNRIMVAQQRAGGRGHTWLRGRLVIYYSNDYSYVARKQSEDRSHRIGQTEKVTYVDLVAEDTSDKKILGALKSKKDVADYFSSDPTELLR
jgi:SNF2 family DNA or RNA helicase